MESEVPTASRNDCRAHARLHASKLGNKRPCTKLEARMAHGSKLNAAQRMPSRDVGPRGKDCRVHSKAPPQTIAGSRHDRQLVLNDEQAPSAKADRRAGTCFDTTPQKIEPGAGGVRCFHFSHDMLAHSHIRRQTQPERIVSAFLPIKLPYLIASSMSSAEMSSTVAAGVSSLQ